MVAKVFFCGEVVADLLEQVQDSGSFKLMLGGSHYFATVGAAKAIIKDNLPLKACFVGTLSQDMFGDRFMKTFENMGVSTDYVTRVPNNTSLALVSIRQGADNAFSFYGEHTAEQMTRIEDLPASLGDENERKVCCFGSVSTIIEPARYAWLEFARRLRTEHNCLIYYDLNTRPSIVSDLKAYRELIHEWASVAHIMKASDSDAEYVYPGLPYAEVAQIWMEAGASMGIVTKSAQGAAAFTRNLSVSVGTTELIAKNTVGCGDNFNAGIGLGLAMINCVTADGIDAMARDELVAIIDRANKMAAAHLLALGAKPRNARLLNY